MEPSKKDWKLFRENIAKWQESYMERLIKEYVEYLNSDVPASTKFWEMEKNIKKDRIAPGVCLELRKSNMFWDIALLIKDDVITFDALDEFSDELKEAVSIILNR